MTAQAIIALVCGLLWAGLFYLGVRFRDGWTILVVLLAWIVNLALGSGYNTIGGVVRIVNTGLVVLLLADRLTKNPEHVKRVAAAQVADARREMHSAINDRAAWEARAVAYRRLLAEHGIHT